MSTVAERPGRRLVAGHRLHLHVDGQQIVAAVGLLDHAVEEEARRHALAHEAALHVREGDHHRVDLARLDQLFQLAQVQKSVHWIPLLPLRRGCSVTNARAFALALPARRYSAFSSEVKA
jgi:hypothetical protein